MKLTVDPHLHCLLIMVLVPFDLGDKEDHGMADPEEAVLFGEIGECTGNGAAEAVGSAALYSASPLTRQILAELLILVLNEDFMAVGFVLAAVFGGVLAKVDKLDDIGVSDAGSADELCVTGLHEFFGRVVKDVFIDKLFGDGVAIGTGIYLYPILHK